MPINAMRLRIATLTERMRVIFGATSAKGYMLRVDSLSGLTQDTAGTTPVVSVADPVGRVLDLSGNGNHFTQGTAGNRPLWNGSGIDFDGAGDALTYSSLDLAGSTHAYVVFAGQKTTGDNNACIMFHSASPLATDGSVSLWANGGSIVNYQHSARGTTAGTQARISHPSDVLASAVSYWKLNTGVDLNTQLDVWHNGTSQTIGAGVATGTGSLTTQNHFIGANGTAAQNFLGIGRRYAVLGTTTPLTTEQLNTLIAWAEEGRV